ncbi:hypothetical protein ACFWQG_13210 [Rhodococcus sp. NPDC058532]|uniref:hypothetical protein n=1 Tax=Rhodococcus sp. NPDC058532 TaxID=3346540 RepID=UPI0036633EC0
MTTLEDFDAREMRALAREEARDEAREAAAANVAPAYSFVDAPPASKNKIGRSIPEYRVKMINLARRNPGRWLEYPSTPADSYTAKQSASFASDIRKGKRGFAGGAWEAQARGGVVYLRYLGEDA